MWVIMDLIFIAHFETLTIEKEYCKQRCLICLEKARRWDVKQDTEVACLGGTADGEDLKQQRESPGHQNVLKTLCLQFYTMQLKLTFGNIF